MAKLNCNEQAVLLAVIDRMYCNKRHPLLAPILSNIRAELPQYLETLLGGSFETPNDTTPAGTLAATELPSGDDTHGCE